jgi:molecular chaperone GrpE (heat shock protein)
MEGAHADLREAGRAVREARALLAEALGRHDRLGAHLTAAWRGQDDLTARHQRLLLGLLRVLDDCAHLMSLGHEVAVVHDGLHALLREHGVEVMPVTAGEPFDGERHRSQETVAGTDLPAGVVVDVLAAGYLRRAGGTTVVIRPATVRVSAPGSR